MNNPRSSTLASVAFACTRSLALYAMITLCVACTSADNSNRDAGGTGGDDSGSSGHGNDAGVAKDGGHPAPQSDAAAEPPDAGLTTLSLCSGCASETLDPSDLALRFHHVHLNVTDPEASSAFYRRFFGAQAVRLNDKADALWLAPMLFLLHEVAVAPNDTLEMGLDHVGRGSDDPVKWFDQASKQGVMGDPRLESSATPTQIGTLTFIYVRGPDAERMEVYNVGTVVVPGHEADAKEFQHVHFLTPDLDATTAWYAALLGQPANTNPLGRDITIDRTSLFFLNTPLPPTFVATDDRPIGHIAFSVSDLAMLRDRAETLGVEIVAEPALAPEGFRSFFVRGPDQVLLEFVEAGPIMLP